jgi:hypothetical protein
MMHRMRLAILLAASLLGLAVAVVGCGVSSRSAGPAGPVASATVTAEATDSASADTETATGSDGGSDSAKGAPSSSATARRYVQQIAGVNLGDADASAIKVYGPGLFTTKEGDGGGRYYVDAAHTKTLHLELGAESVIDGIELSYGVILPAGLTLHDDPRVISPALAGTVPASKGITLGMSMAQIKERLGEPSREERTGVMRTFAYYADTDDSAYYAEFMFVDNRLRSIWISDSK